MATTTPELTYATVSSFPLPPAVLQPLVAALEGPVNSMLLATIWSSFLIPILVALLLSNSQKWKTPIFIMNVCAVAFGLVFGAMTIYFEKQNIALKPVGPTFLLGMTCLYFFVPISTQSILLVRVMAVYPLRELGWTQGMLIYGTFTTIQTTRLINATLDFVRTARLIHNAENVVVAIQIAWTLPYIKVEVFLQLAYDIFASGLFLLRLHQGGALRTNGAEQASIFTGGKRSTYTSRLRGLFWIAVSNFVFPVILNVTLIVFLFRDPNIQDGVDVMVVNICVDIICVVLATVWCSGTHWQSAGDPGSGARAQVPEEKTILSISTATFALPSVHASRTATELDIEMGELTK